MVDKKNSTWSSRRIEPLTSSDDGDVDAIRAQLAQIHQRMHAGSATTRSPQSLIDTFWHQHGHKSDHESAWREFYESLEDHQKQQLWDEYHQVVSTISEPDMASSSSFKTFDYRGSDDQSLNHPPGHEVKRSATLADTKKHLLAKSTKKTSRGRLKRHFKPFISAFTVMFLILLVNYNPLVIAQVKQYISPGDNLQGPVIIDPNESINVGKEPKIIIPKINVDVPVVYDIKTFNEADIQAGLERGVVHYGNTPLPGEPGNNVIVGHSSNNFFNSGKYKFAFVLLERLELGDTFILHYDGVRYVYKVTNRQIIDPNDFSLLQPTATPTTTLITCTPAGTSWHRLVIQGQQISPQPTTEKPAETDVTPSGEEATIVPGNAPSLWQRFKNWLFGD